MHALMKYLFKTHQCNATLSGRNDWKNLPSKIENWLASVYKWSLIALVSSQTMP